MVKLNLPLPESFFAEEVRDGYTVTAKMKKIWAVELDLLHELLRVCREHGIEVFAFAGTLLGAVRHKGFIPWDDDMDVCMTREHFERLKRVAGKAFRHPYFFQTAQTDTEFFFGYARLRNSETTGLITYNRSAGYNNGIYIDIFVLDGFVEDAGKLRRQMIARGVLSRLLGQYHRDTRRVGGWKRHASRLLQHTVCRCVPREALMARYDRVLSAYTGETERLALMTHPVDWVRRYWCRKSDLEQREYLPFEVLEIPVPATYDAMLTHMYGDYMQFPPPEQRGAWHEDILIFEPDMPYKEYLRLHG